MICGVDVRERLSQGVRPQEEVYLMKWCHKYEWFDNLIMIISLIV